MRSNDEIQHALNLFNLWIESGMIGHMETEGDAQLVYSGREILKWVSGGQSNSFNSNIQMFRETLIANDIIKVN